MLPAHTDDADNELTDGAAVAEPDGVRPSPTSELVGLLARDGLISRDAQGLETELVSCSQTQILCDAPPPVSSMPDMNSRPSGGASLDNRVPPPAHSAAPPPELLPSSNKPMGRTTEDSARAPQKEKPRCALGSHEDMALGSESPTPVLEHKHAAPEPSPTSESREDRCSRLQLCGICETCGRDIPVGQCFTSLEVGLKCYIFDGSQHKFAAPEKARIMRNSRSGLQHGHAEPKENLPKQAR